MWRRRRRYLRVRRYTTLSAGASLCAGLCASAALYAAASNEHALRQALTIVQLLRAEFGRLDPKSTDTPAPTCAPTPGVMPSRRYWTTWNTKATPMRRMDYEDAFGAHPSVSDIPKPLTTASSTSNPESPTGSSQNDLIQDITTPTATPPSTPIQPSAPTTPSITSTQPSAPSTPTNTPTLPSAATTSPNTPTQPSVPSTPSTSTPLSSAKDISNWPKRGSSFGSTTPLSTASFNASATASSLKSMPPTILKTSTKELTANTLVTLSSVTKPNSGNTGSITKPGTASGTPRKLGLTKEHPTIDTTAPELQQVALALAGELDETVRPRRPRPNRPRARPTWREHLPRSTRYAVPLPENHAFCYTDPGNALCRTLI